MKKVNLEWLYAAGVRAVKTMAQTALGMFTVGAAMSDVQWGQVASVAFVAGIYSLLTSFATSLPEVGSDGDLKIDTSNPEKDTYRLDLTAHPYDLSSKKTIRLKVDPNADLSQK